MNSNESPPPTPADGARQEVAGARWNERVTADALRLPEAVGNVAGRRPHGDRECSRGRIRPRLRAECSMTTDGAKDEIG